MPPHAPLRTVGLTSITPGWPDDRALGVQLPHSLSDPRTSPLRSSRRGGKNVQFGNRRRSSPERFCRLRSDVAQERRPRRSSPTASPAKNHLLHEAIRSLAETSSPPSRMSGFDVARAGSQWASSRTRVAGYGRPRPCTCK